MIVKQGVQDFYEKYGIEFSSPVRRQIEHIASVYKVSNLCSLMEGLRPKRIVDFGCGLGDALDMLAKHFRVTNAIGIDISSTMIAYAKKQYPEYIFLQGSNEKLKNIHVDLLTFFDVLEHIEDIPGILRLARTRANYIGIKIPLEKPIFISLLNSLHLRKRKSHLYCSEGHLYEFNRKEVEVILEQAGLKILKTKTDLPPQKILCSGFVKNRMKVKSGFLAGLKYYVYIVLGEFPYLIRRPIFELVSGVDFFVLCKTN